MLKKNDLITVEITDYGMNGEGVAKHQGCVVFVPFAIIGEVCNVIIILAKKGFYVGKTVSIEKPSAVRIPPPCPYFTKCGGCDVQHIEYNQTLQLKANSIINTFRKAGVAVEANQIIKSNKLYEYRNKFAFPVAEINGAAAICMYRQNSHSAIPIENCIIQEPWAKEIIKICNAFFSQYKIPAYNETTKKGLVKHVVARGMNNQILISIVINGNSLPHEKELVEKLINKFEKELATPIGLSVNINKLHNNVILTETFKHVYGLKEIVLTEFGITYTVNMGSFIQVNNYIQNEIYKQVLLETNGGFIINAYSGAGLLSGIIAKNIGSRQCLGIEIVKDAHLAAENLKCKNKLTNLTNICGDCAIELETITKQVKEPFVLVLDPPRKGVAEKVLHSVIKADPQKIIYVSCNPATLARDCAMLSKSYAIKSLTPYDMFPQTKHVETVVVLEKAATE